MCASGEDRDPGGPMETEGVLEGTLRHRGGPRENVAASLLSPGVRPAPRSVPPHDSLRPRKLPEVS